MRKRILCIIFSSIIPGWVYAQDSLKTELLKEVVVTGTKFDLSPDRSGKVIFKLEQNQLRFERNLGDLLNEVPGIQMDGNYGSPGTNLSYFVRGGRSKQTLILLDGVPLNDPSGIDPAFDLRFLTPNQIGKVEVLEGGLSTLYGSGASAAVINVKTKDSDTTGIHGEVDLNAGSWESFGQNIGLRGGWDKISFQFVGSNYSSKGFSAALDEDQTKNFDDDGFLRRNGLLKIRYQFNPMWRLDVFGGVDWFDAEFDDGAFVDGDNAQTQVQRRIGVSGAYNYAKGYVNFVVQQTSLRRDITGSYPTKYDGSTLFGEVSHKHELNSNWTLLSGLSIQHTRYGEAALISKDTTSFIMVDPYVSVLLGLPSGFNVHAGIRVNNHSNYGSKLIYNFNPSWIFGVSQYTKVKVFASASTSFITPTLFQLYTPWGGNLNLQPEESFNREYGISFYTMNKFTFTAVNYFRKEKHAIGYTFQYDNISTLRNIKGVTIDVQYEPMTAVKLTGDFSWVTSDDKESFYRIPSYKAGVGLQLKAIKGSIIQLGYHYTGTRTDLYFDEFFNANEVNLASFDLFDLNISQYLFKDHILVYGSLFNITDEKFIGVYGYTTRGRNFLLGVKFNF